MRRAICLFVAAISLLAGVPHQAKSQITGGAVAGVVRNQVGEPIAAAKVEITNAGTNQIRSTVTDDQGSYRVLSLPVGSYTVRVEADQYTKVTRQLTLRVNEDVRVDFELSAAGTAERVSVVGSSAPITETSNSVLGIVIDNKQIMDLPLNGRNFLQLGALVANVSSTASLKGAAEGGLLNGPFAVSGQRDRALSFFIDGVDNNNSLSNSLSALVSIDAIQEFKMVTTMGPAEYGNHSGGTINIVTKSGTNDFHGSAFEFFRDDRLNAPNYFEKIGGMDASIFRNNQFGGTVGGRLIKDRTFFLGNFEGQRLRVASTQFSNVPTAAERQGIFTNPATGQTVQLPVDPVSAKILERYVPLPNASTASGNYVSSPAITSRNDFGLVKVDHLLTGDDVLNVRYLISNNRTFNPVILNQFQSPSVSGSSAPTPSPSVPGFGLYEYARTQNLAVGYTHNFSMQTINDFRFGYNRHFTQLTPEDKSTPAELGFVVGSATPTGLFETNIPGMTSLGNMRSYPIDISMNNFHWSDSLSLLRGRHAIKVGGEARWIRQAETSSQLGAGALIFSGSASKISPMADFIMGVPSSTANYYRRSFGSPMRQTNAGLYGQDDYQVSPRVVLNLGLRYEVSTVLSSPTHALTNFSIPRGFFTPDVNTDTGLYSGDHNNFAPRLGFAWSVGGDGRTVVRGGYGIYYDTIAHTRATFLNLNDLVDIWRTSSLAVRGPGKLASIFDPATLGRSTSGASTSPRAYEYNLRTPYAQHFNLNVQREVGQKVLVSFGYVGAKGTKLVGLRDLNQAIYLPGTDANGKPLSTSDRTNVLGRRPTQYYHLTAEPLGTIIEEGTGSSSIYHSFQATLSKRLSNGLSFLSAYTWSKSIDDATDPIGFSGDLGGPQNSRDVRRERGLSIFDTRQKLTLGYTYLIPLHGSRWIDGWQVNGVTVLQSGQPFSVLLGFDPSLTDSRTPRPNNAPGAIVNKKGQLYLNPSFPIDPVTKVPIDLIPKTGEFGTMGRNTFVGPGYKNFDLSLIKDTVLREKMKVQFRFEVFNLFNTTNLALPNRLLTDSFFGRSTKTQDVAGGVPGIGGGGPRVAQLALKFVY